MSGNVWLYSIYVWQTIKKATKKIMMKITKFLQYLKSRDKFRKNLFCKVYKSIYLQKDNFSVFYYLFFIRIFCILLKLFHYYWYHVTFIAKFTVIPYSAHIFNQNVTFYTKYIAVSYVNYIVIIKHIYKMCYNKMKQ